MVRYYLAYKYSNNKNKEDLIKKLEELSQKITNWGHETFLLGRDVKKWQHVHFGSITLIPVIYNNMKNCDVVVAFVDSKSFSKGLLFEVIILKILGKKSILLCENDNCCKLIKMFFQKQHNLSNVNDIKMEMLQI